MQLGAKKDAKSLPTPKDQIVSGRGTKAAVTAQI